ncbi:efflux RND transporter periplasmic adaptor subunit [Fuerstiella marisgermanici]|uniref:Multidrug transporter MdtA n=1 Tax=Fuerstiella marisgermanici TaxID=1891926 RepID=A0A1P8W9N0_9PLAN|nr:efflux RND transporter periplasmic adaptor subunit [Fuerstiella marisgermanici]APZ90749.1 Multidrug transporter MdtA [Fuerstiella marisgermanici]
MNDAIQQRPNARWRWLRVLGTLFVCCAILGAAVAAVVVINKTEPTAQKENSSRKSAALVETVTVERGTYAPRLVVLGTVQAAQDIVLSPRVSGQVIDMSSKLVPGGMVRKGDLLLRIDPADFENAVSIRQSELAQKEASREIEQARQRLAEKELKMLEGSIDGANRSLVLREPQIASIEAEVSAAKAQVERATLDLDRTSVHAPFDAQVLSRSVNIGSQVGPNDELARLIGLDEYWIMAAVPVRSLRWVRFPKVTDQDSASSNSESYDGSGSTVILRNPDIWGPGVERTARVARMIGTLDSQTRLARVLIIVDDPLGLESDAPPLLLDTLIETEIEGQPIEDVVRLQRDYVRGNDTVWVKKDDKLEIRDTEIIFRDLQYAYVTSGLEAGEEVVTTTLATVAEGIGLRKVGEEAPEDTAETSSEEVSSDDASSDENASDEASGQSESNSAGESSDTSKAEQAIDVTHTLSAVLARTVAACATSGLRSSSHSHSHSHSHSQERTPDCQAACFHGACWRTSQKDAVA